MISVIAVILTLIIKSQIEFNRLSNSVTFNQAEPDYDYFDIEIEEVNVGNRFSDFYADVVEDYEAKEGYELHQVIIKFKNNLVESPVKFDGWWVWEDGTILGATFLNPAEGECHLPYLVRGFKYEDILDLTRSFKVGIDSEIRGQYIYELPVEFDLNDFVFTQNGFSAGMRDIYSVEAKKARTCNPIYKKVGLSVGEFDYDCLKFDERER